MHEISRILRAVSSRAWFIDPARADEIVAILELRAQGHTGGFAAAAPAPPVADPEPGAVAVLRLHGAILPRADMLSEMSGAVSLEKFRAAFAEAAGNPRVRAIVLDIDSPGGDVSFVPETVAEIRAARRDDRPIVAVANNMAASAAYWIAAAADEIVITPSGQVGAIGVYMLHKNIAAKLEAEGVAPTFIFEGPRKIEANPFEPLDDTARAALQRIVSHHYAMMVDDIAAFRGVEAAVVRADPEIEAAHFGGGREVLADDAVRLGLADSVATLEQTLARMAARGRPARRARAARRRLALG